MTRTVIIGVGNTLMGDDGVGVRVAQALAERDLGPDVEVIEAHAASFALAGHLLAADRALIVDAIDASAEPGATFRFTPEDVGLASLRSNTSHGFGVPQLIGGARLAGCRADIVVYAIQVGRVGPQAESLTDAVERAAARITDLVAEDAGSGCA